LITKYREKETYCEKDKNNQIPKKKAHDCLVLGFFLLFFVPPEAFRLGYILCTV